MIRTDGKKLGLKELALPMFFSCLGALIVVASVPGQGKTGFTALGIALALIGCAIARHRIREQRQNRQP